MVPYERITLLNAYFSNQKISKDTTSMLHLVTNISRLLSVTTRLLLHDTKGANTLFGQALLLAITSLEGRPMILF